MVRSIDIAHKLRQRATALIDRIPWRRHGEI
ncbi:hypothetical protein X729_32355 [Mesorhizobium sp. L103C131B0]|nr:hypothetical protein X729_32355 [Mesorhizobium sp. L103C131B0]